MIVSSTPPPKLVPLLSPEELRVAVELYHKSKETIPPKPTLENK